ncbi:hypothetical protein K7G19_21000 [Cupriavidus sp. DB3]|uniref:hypothetical protein n=1 Tax=Cupriavidus sp. DB3 TaxID=2873259 RepID=UPI001CF1091B|nr:hypothetical protein [Cupriavidus sp. DB3]MCA7086072.1 hypothetical protein [Cupriavidus sp. DB3]
MRDYGKMPTALWSDPGFLGLSDQGKVLALYLLSSPHTNMIGAFRLPDGYVAEDLRWPIETVSERFAELSRNGFATRDEGSKWVVIHKFCLWNDIENPNQGKAAAKLFHQVPDDCPVKPVLARALRDFAPKFPAEVREPFETLGERLPKPFRNQEQEQEQEQKRNTPHTPQGGNGPETERVGKPKRSAIGLPAYLKACKQQGVKPIAEDDTVFAYAEQAGIPLEFLRLHWLEFKARYSLPDAKRYKDWPAVHRKSVRGNWFKLWYIAGDGNVVLTTVGEQARRVHAEAA